MYLDKALAFFCLSHTYTPTAHLHPHTHIPTYIPHPHIPTHTQLLPDLPIRYTPPTYSPKDGNNFAAIPTYEHMMEEHEGLLSEAHPGATITVGLPPRVFDPKDIVVKAKVWLVDGW